MIGLDPVQTSQSVFENTRKIWSCTEYNPERFPGIWSVCKSVIWGLQLVRMMGKEWGRGHERVPEESVGSGLSARLRGVIGGENDDVGGDD